MSCAMQAAPHLGPVSLEEEAEDPLPGGCVPSAPAWPAAGRLPGAVGRPEACQWDSGGARKASSGGARLKGAGPCTTETRHLSSMARRAATTSGANLHAITAVDAKDCHPASHTTLSFRRRIEVR